MRQRDTTLWSTLNAKKNVFDLVCKQDMSKSLEQRDTVNNVKLED